MENNELTVDELMGMINSTTILAKRLEGWGEQMHLERIKTNMDIIERSIENHGGEVETFSQMGRYGSRLIEKLQYIRPLLRRQLQKQKPKPIIATELASGTTRQYGSMYATQKDLGVNPGQIKMICEGTNRVKTAKSKKNGKRYSFEYA